MKETIHAESFNHDLLSLIPKDAATLIEVGCSDGALAQAYKQINGRCAYIGVEHNSELAKMAQAKCDTVYALDIEAVDDAFLEGRLNGDCWIFGDVLEHLCDPWRMLSRIRKIIPEHGSIVACIPNAQHWSVQARLSIGDFRYGPGGLMDKTHLRWFTRITIIELFKDTGFQVVEGIPRIFHTPNYEKYLEAIRIMAITTEADPDLAVADSMPMQYVVKAIPIRTLNL